MTTFKTSEECAVELIAYSRSARPSGKQIDHFPAQAARVSFNNDQEYHTADQDRKLIKYLAEHKHLTPFEYQHATVMIECPLFIRSQIHRHRTFSFNEISRRYTSEEIGFWIPSTFRTQATSNRQASEGEHADSKSLEGFYKSMVEAAAAAYETMVKSNVAREQARAILPQSLLTRFYMGGNLRNWAHFLKLRLDSHAQPEVQIVAQKIQKILTDLWPTSLGTLLT